MENQHQKWVNLSFLAGAGLVGYVVFVLAFRVAANFDLEARVQDIDLIIRGASLAITALVFVILWSNKKSNVFMNEVVLELSRVTWPTQDMTTKATLVTLILVILAGVFLGGLDSLFRWTIGLIL